MKIQGNLATYEFSDLLQWLAQGNKTGILTLSDGEVEYQLGFDQGRIDMSSSSDPRQRLDSYLHARGVIDEATLARAERLREATKMMSGQVLVTLGAVNEPQLAQALREKTEEILCELLTWDHGTFEFEGGERPAATMVPINLEVTKLLLESMHRLDQLRGGRPAPPAAPPAAGPLPVTAGGEASQTDGAATQAIDGLALAEVLDPEVPASPGDDGAAARPTDRAPVDYAVMQSRPGLVQRLVPFAVVALLTVTGVVVYLVNREASAQAVETGPAGSPILFSRTAGPLPVGDRAVGVVPAAVTAPPAPATEAGEPESDEALRRRYERQLADLRRELEEARRANRPAARVGRGSAGREAEAELPADSIMRAAVSRAEPPAPAVEAKLAKSEPAPARATPPVPEAAPAGPAPAEPAAIAEEVADEEEPASLADPAPRTVQLSNPRLIDRPSPRYPLAALRHGRGATVKVRVLVGADGKVLEVERVGSRAGMGFDRAAEDAARASTWQSGTRNGEPTEMWAELRFEFKP